MTEIRRTIAEEFKATQGYDYPHEPGRPPALSVPDEDCVLWDLVERRRNELGMAPPWFMDELRRLEVAANGFLDEHGEPALPADEVWDDGWDPETDWREGQW